MAIDVEGLISKSLSDHTKNVLTNDNIETLTFHIDVLKGINYLDIYSNNKSTWQVEEDGLVINNIGHSYEQKEFINSIFSQLDLIIDLDFKEMETNNGSDIDIYHINYSSMLETNAIGQVLAQSSPSGFWWDIFWKDTNNST